MSRSSFRVNAPAIIQFKHPTSKLILTATAGSNLSVVFNSSGRPTQLLPGTHHFNLNITSLRLSGTGQLSGLDLGGAQVIGPISDDPELIIFPDDFLLSDAVNPYVGSITLTTNAAIAAFGALGHDAITGNLIFTQASSGAITTLAPLSNLKFVGGLLDFNANSLTSLTGLEAMRRVGNGFQLTGSLLTNISALYNMRAFLNYLDISSMPLLTSMEGAFPYLTTAPNIYVQSLDGLVSLKNAFPSLQSSEYVSVSYNTELTDVDGMFGALTTVTGAFGLDLYYLPALTTFGSAFGSLASIIQSGLLIEHCYSVTALNFPLLVSTKIILINSCYSLTSIRSGLSPIVGSTVTTKFEVRFNAALPTNAQVIALKDDLVAEGMVAPIITYSNNGPG